MNSRSSVNETNVNFSADLPTLNQFDSKDGLLSFPFDHIYACHSQSSDQRQPLQLEKEIEITTHCATPEQSPEVIQLTEQLTSAQNQNKKLKDLMLFHLDLIQQQNELLTKKDKMYLALKEDYDALKATLIRPELRQEAGSSGQSQPTSTVTPTAVKTEPVTPEVMLNSFSELLIPADRNNPFVADQNPRFGHVAFGIARSTSETTSSEGSVKPATIKAPPPVLVKKLHRDNFKMIDNKRTLVKKDTKTESRSEALYTVTSNSGNPIIQRIHKNRKRASSIGSLSRMNKTPKPETVTSKTQHMQPDQGLEFMYGANKEPKMINTYGKSRTASATTMPKRTTQFTGSLSDRLQLIDTTPTGEDPYQLGEADMREQSPIPKLMLQKTNYGRMKICTDPMGESSTRRIHDMPDTKAKINRFMSVYEEPPKEKTIIVHEPDLDLVKTETEIAWPIYNETTESNDPSLCDFSYGETSMLPSLDANEFQELFTSDAALNLDNLKLDVSPEKMVPETTTKRRVVRTTSLMVPSNEDELDSTKSGMGNRRGRKRAFSTTGMGKQRAAKDITKPRASRGGRGLASDESTFGYDWSIQNLQ